MNGALRIDTARSTDTPPLLAMPCYRLPAARPFALRENSFVDGKKYPLSAFSINRANVCCSASAANFSMSAVTVQSL